MRKIPNPKFQITNSQTNFRETVSCLLSHFLSLFLVLEEQTAKFAKNS